MLLRWGAALCVAALSYSCSVLLQFACVALVLQMCCVCVCVPQHCAALGGC